MKRVIKSGLSIWKFSNTPNGMLIEKNGNDLQKRKYKNSEEMGILKNIFN